jgi:hypothetical protein
LCGEHRGGGIGGRTRGRVARSFPVPPITDPGDDRPDRGRLVLADDDLEQRPGHIGLVAHVRLVGLDLDQLLADGDLVADLLAPRQHRPLLHRVGEARHGHLLHRGLGHR